ncbi:pyrroline-5-carboxylate reductase 3 isoform X2 [Thrips palmi]|uniref:Pyrroline-5-carboxylate reductase n=1 Tax=Thrips palmi TaxID=161013 RepID=A0A6P9A0H0_THRPL|nr:pyrroline-5-carboxylate reductase 3 isoform X2 [Thrips palmi]
MDRMTIQKYLRESTLGFIGAGQMAQAIADGLVKQGLIMPGDIYASAPSERNLRSWKEKGMNVTHRNDDIVKNCKTIFLAVKPQYLNEALSAITPTLDKIPRLFVSVIAGISSTALEEALSTLVPSSRVVRVMPNTPLRVGAGCSVFCGGCTSVDRDTEIVKGLLSELGLCLEIKESMMSGAGVIAGCGPAFMYMMIEAIADGGVNMGVPREMAQQLAAQTMLGAAQMVLKTGQHPGQLKDEVCSPGGSTIAGVQALEKCAIRSAMMAAVEASTLRSIELGKRK